MQSECNDSEDKAAAHECHVIRCYPAPGCVCACNEMNGVSVIE